MRLPGDLDRRSIPSKIQRAIDERVTVAPNDIAAQDLIQFVIFPCGTSVLSAPPARRLALLEKAGLVNHEDRIVIRQMLDDIIAHDIAQAISIPIPV